MPRPADAIVTGFVKSPALLALSLAPLRTLKQEGVLRDIHYVTWDGAEIDAHVAPLAAMPDVHLVRVPQPQAQGSGNQRGVIYQIRNLEAALAQVREDDAIVLKSRPDFVADTDFLRGKITSFDQWSAVRTERIGAHMPKPVLHDRIWVPWADSNQPFFYEDAAFMGRKRDLRKLVTELAPRDLEILGDPDCGWFAHVVRYARMFAPRYPIFARYLNEYPWFVNNLGFRFKQLDAMIAEGFFWHMLIAHAWILHSQFHVDAGEPGALLFYANNANMHADWSRPETLRVARPYDCIDKWRGGTKPGLAMMSVRRAYGRLMDDDWQDALFTRALPDLPKHSLEGLLENAAHYRDGRLAQMEDAFYARMAAVYRENWPPSERSPDDIVQIARASGQHDQTVEAHRHAG